MDAVASTTMATFTWSFWPLAMVAEAVDVNLRDLADLMPKRDNAWMK
jgi:hypothetical protein